MNIKVTKLDCGWKQGANGGEKLRQLWHDDTIDFRGVVDEEDLELCWLSQRCSKALKRGETGHWQYFDQDIGLV